MLSRVTSVLRGWRVVCHALGGRQGAAEIASSALSGSGKRADDRKAPDARESLDELEDAIERLKVLYEQYFIGVERTAPTRVHDQVERAIRNLERSPLRNTVARFRFQGLKARLVTYKHYWTRILTQIENGTHRRELHRRRASPIVVPAPIEATSDPLGNEAPTGAPTDAPPPSAATDFDSPARSATGGRPTAAPPPPPKAPLPPGMSAREVRALFDDLVRAKRAAGESLDGLSYASLIDRLAKEVPRLQERHKCNAVKFEVATTDGKVRLRARPGES